MRALVVQQRSFITERVASRDSKQLRRPLNQTTQKCVSNDTLSSNVSLRRKSCSFVLVQPKVKARCIQGQLRRSK
uniref:Uncharacterized protein n=1 Tax=Solanum lycopersicum TaxID=4081 RepID=A0A3Q7H7W7_SOLLC